MASTAGLKEIIKAGQWDDVFARLYGGATEVLHRQRKRYIEALEGFEGVHGAREEVRIYSTPGRTEIGGNHTDHNNGLVMAAAVNLDIIAVVAKNNGHFARVHSKGFANPDIVDLTYLERVNLEYGKSSALVRGVAAGIKQRGGFVDGFDAYTMNDVLAGSGLSSSAAFEVCMAAVLNGEYNQNRFSAVELGQIGQYAENVFFGKPSGLMDQTACAVGGAITIDFADTENPVVKAIPFDLATFGHRLVITDTGGSHANLTDEYAAVRREMEAVAEVFGKKVLREVPREDFFKKMKNVRCELGDRAVLRALHFYEECRRVPLLAGAIETSDFAAFLRLIREGGHSSFEYNQNAYSVQDVKEQGVPLGLALSQMVLGEEGAWRLQGGGFAGTIQAFVPEALLTAYCRQLEAVFGDGACHVLTVRAQGTGEVMP